MAPPDLRLNDFDSVGTSLAKHGGVAAPAPATPYVQQLNDGLRELGFLLAPTGGAFTLETEWAVRFFQGYAKLCQAAQVMAPLPGPIRRYSDALTTFEIPEENRYAGGVHGIFDGKTRTAFDYWIANSLRCPMVIEGWDHDKNNIPLLCQEKLENIWRDVEGRDSQMVSNSESNGVRVFLRYFGDQFEIPDRTGNTRRAPSPDERTEILGWSTPPKNSQPGGPNMSFTHAWRPECEALPDVFGIDVGSAPTASTYRVVRGFSEQECLGFLDVVNAWDMAILSLGPCHWTVESGRELAPFLAYFRTVDTDGDFERYFLSFGLQPEAAWEEYGVEGEGGEGAGAGELTPQITFNACFAALDDTEKWRPLTRPQAEWLRGWHWVVRFSLAGRLSSGFRKAMWDFARLRIRDLLALGWPSPRSAPRLVSDVFSSEMCVSLLVRSHIKKPVHCVAAHRPDSELRDAYRRALKRAKCRDGASTAPAQVDLAVELVAQFEKFNGKDITARKLFCWPSWSPSGSALGNPYTYTVTSSTTFQIKQAMSSSDVADFIEELRNTHAKTQPDFPDALVEELKKYTKSKLGDEATFDKAQWVYVDIPVGEKIEDRVCVGRLVAYMNDAHYVVDLRGRRDKIGQKIYLLLDGVEHRAVELLSFAPDSFTLDAAGVPPTAAPSAEKLYLGYPLRRGDWEANDRSEGAVLRFATTSDRTAELGDAIVVPLDGDLRKDFQEHDIVLSDTATSHVVTVDSEWRIKDLEGSGAEFRLLLDGSGGSSPLKVSEFKRHKYGGTERYHWHGNVTPASNDITTWPIHQLQADLLELGFSAIGTPDGDFGSRTHEAVKEFQRIASNDCIAKQISDDLTIPYPLRLCVAKNETKYTGRIDGVANAETRYLIGLWRTNKLRHPSVFAAVDLLSGDPVDGFDNLWFVNDYMLQQGEIRLWDFSGEISGEPVSPGDLPDPISVGRPRLGAELECVNGERPDGAGVSEFQQCSPEAEFTPSNVDPEEDYSQQGMATFRALRAVIEETNGGFLDGLISTPQNFLRVAGLHQEPAAGSVAGELTALLAHMENLSREGAEKSFGRHGYLSNAPWESSAAPNGVGLFDPDLRRYSSNLHVSASIPTKVDDQATFLTEEPITESDGPLFRSWRTIARIKAAARQSASFRQGVWDFLRLRLRELFDTPWTPGDRSMTLGRVYASERSGSVLLLWHLNRPDQIVTAGAAAAIARQAVADAGLDINNVDAWTSSDEALLLASLIALAPADLKGAFGRVLRWPDWEPGDATDPRKFQLSPSHLTIAEIDDADGAIAGELDAETTLPVAIRAPLAAKHYLLAPDAELQLKRVGAMRWRIVDPTAGKQRTLWARKLGDVIHLRGGSSSERTADGWLLRDRLPPPADWKAQVSKYLVPIGETGVGGGSDRLRIGLIYEMGDDGVTLLTGVGLSRSTHPTDGFLLEVDNPSAETTPLLPLLAPTGGSWSLDTSPSGDPLSTPVRPVDPGRPGEIPANDFEIQLRLSGWQSESSLLPLTASLRLADLAFDGPNLVGAIRLNFRMSSGFLQTPIDWSVAGDGDLDAGSADLGDFAVAGDQITFANAPLGAKLKSFLPFAGLPATFTAPLRVSRSSNGFVFDAANTLSAGALAIPLGSSAAKLEFGSPIQFGLSSDTALSLLPSGDVLPRLGLDLFRGSFGADVKQAWGSVGSSTFSQLFQLKPPGPLAFPADTPLLQWTDGRGLVAAQLIESLVRVDVNNALRLETMGGPALGEDVRSAVALAKDGAFEALFELSGDESQWRLEVPVRFQVSRNGADYLTIVGRFAFTVEADITDPRGVIPLSQGSFQVEPTIDLEVESSVHETFASDMVSLFVPKHTIFTFSTNPLSTRLFLNTEKSRENTGERPVIRMPASKTGNGRKAEENRFSFELGKLNLSSDGIDIRGRVRSESIPLPPSGSAIQSGFKTPVRVNKPQAAESAAAENESAPQMGEIEFTASQLTYAAMEATGSLRYFDNAEVTVGFWFEQNTANGQSSMRAGGQLTVRDLRFDLSAVYSRVDVQSLVLHTKYDSANDAWNSGGNLTGSLLLQAPEGTRGLGPAETLFSGTRFEFKKLDPVRLGLDELTIDLPRPVTFEFADVFAIGVSKLRIGGSEDPLFGVSGFVSIKNLAGVDSTIDFDELTIGVGDDNPTVSVKEIGIQLAVADSFKLGARVREKREAEEYGFEGSFNLKTSAIEELRGLIGLTSVKTLDKKSFTPAPKAYLELPLTIPLFGSPLFLRRIGVGFGINQTLRGLEITGPEKDLKERLEAFTSDPLGLPNPAEAKSWRPAPPPSASSFPNWLLVGSGLITMGNAPFDKECPFTGYILLAIRKGEVVAGANVWAFTSPNQAQEQEYFQRPLGRGGLIFNMEERSMIVHFQTMQNPKLSPRAPELLGKVLSQVRTDFWAKVDPHGLILEVDWPRQASISYDLGPFKGTLSAGFKFGIYRGAISFALNHDVKAKLDLGDRVGFDTRYGSVGVELSLKAEVDARITVEGAIDPLQKPYLYGMGKLDGKGSIRASANARIGPEYSPLKIKVSDSRETGVNADVHLAFEPAGFAAKAKVTAWIKVKGRKLTGSFTIRYDEDRIKGVRDRICELLPSLSSTALTRPVKAPVVYLTPEADEKWQWTFDVRRIERSPGETEFRVLLFPHPNYNYPRYTAERAENDSDRFQIKLKDLAAHGVSFEGFLGAEAPDHVYLPRDTAGPLIWSENLDATIVDRDDVADVTVPEPGTPPYDQDVKLHDLLRMLPDSKTIGDDITETVEVRDERVWRIEDDPNALVEVDPLRLPGDTTYDRLLREACVDGNPALQNRLLRDDEPEGMDSGILYADLVALQENHSVQANETTDQVMFAQHLRCVLVFRGPTEFFQQDSTEVVGRLIDLEDEEEALILAGEPAELRPPVVGGTPEFSFQARACTQSETIIPLVWDLRPEANPGDRGVAPRRIDAFAWVEYFRVSRRIHGSGEDFLFLSKVDPIWIASLKAVDGKPIGLPPPYDFVDRDVVDIADGELIEYRIEAVGREDDRVLSQVEFPVERFVRRPLLAPQQCLARQRLSVADRQLVETIELLVLFASPADDPNADQIRDSLQIRYRPTPIPELGDYLDAAGAVPPVQWRSMLDSQMGVQSLADDVPQVRFAEAVERRQIPWSEGRPLELTDPENTWYKAQVEPTDTENEAQLGFRICIPSDALWGAVLEGSDRRCGVELYVGCDEGAGRRSPLVLCRNVVLFDRQPLAVDDDEPIALRFDDWMGGKNLRALEAIPPLANPLRDADDGGRETEWVSPLVWNGLGVQRDADRQPIAFEGEIPLLPPRRTEAPSGPEFLEPVAHYELFLVDDLDRSVVLSDDQRLVKRVQTLTPRFESDYRSRPLSILPQSTFTSKEELSVEYRPVSEFPPRAIWSSFGPTSFADGRTVTDIPFTRFEPGRLSNFDRAPIWLLQSLESEAERLRSALAESLLEEDLEIEYQISQPLEDVSCEIKDGEGGIEKRVLAFLEANRPNPNVVSETGDAGDEESQSDPYSWRALERLGLACEIRFCRPSGEYLKPEEIEDCLPLRSTEDVAINPVAVYQFFSSDRRTRLYTLRLVYQSSDPTDWRFETNARGFGFRQPLGLAILGRRNEAEPTPLEASAELQAKIQAWLEQVRSATTRANLGGDNSPGQLLTLATIPAFVLNPKEEGAGAPRLYELPDDSAIEVGVRDSGGLPVRHTLRDPWAHQYRIGLKVRRRYDSVWSELASLVDVTFDNRSSELQAPADMLAKVDIFRSEEIAEPVLLANPLRSGIQAILLHSDAYASNEFRADGRAVQQRSGVTIALQRRIPLEVWRKIRVAWDALAAEGNVDWDAYETWLKNPISAGEQAIEPVDRKGPPLLSGGDDGDALAVKPLEAVMNSTPFGRRYIFPDLPAYYNCEYRVIGYETAGERRSPIARSAFVRSLFEGPREELPDPEESESPEPDVTPYRQRPRVLGLGPDDAVYDEAAGMLRIRLPLVHPRLHLLPKLAPLWIDADDSVLIDGKKFRLGSLPDLEMSYLLLIQESPIPSGQRDESKLRPLLTPSCIVYSPFDMHDGDYQHHLKIIGDTTLTRLTLKQTDHGPRAGRIHLTLELSIDEHSPYFSALRAYCRLNGSQLVSELISVVGVRNGIVTERKAGIRAIG